MSSPNQKIIRIGNKNAPKKGDNDYICVFKDVYFEAYRNLTHKSIGLLPMDIDYEAEKLRKQEEAEQGYDLLGRESQSE